MIHFIRDNKNRTLVDIETTKDDIHCAIELRLYTFILLNMEKEKQMDFLNDVDRLDNLRMEWFEMNPPFKKHKRFCKRFADKWQMCYVED